MRALSEERERAYSAASTGSKEPPATPRREYSASEPYEPVQVQRAGRATTEGMGARGVKRRVGEDRADSAEEVGLLFVSFPSLPRTYQTDLVHFPLEVDVCPSILLFLHSNARQCLFLRR